MYSLFEHWAWLFLLILTLVLFLQLREVDRMRVELAATLNSQLNSHLTAMAEANDRRDQELLSLRVRVDRLERGEMP